ncbi:MAG: hypothetical protein EBR35_06185 [Flavobacteriales bacterium]|jgi:hypothetical protein|nr:hypothetical protein [Flavobacteriales bacterium]
MKKQLKTITSILLFGIFIFMGISSGEDIKKSGDSQSEEVVQKINIGSTYSLDAYHQIQFKSANRYWIYQKPLNCGGEGNWSQSGDKIILGPNDSACESTMKIKGEYTIDEILN